MDTLRCGQSYVFGDVQVSMPAGQSAVYSRRVYVQYADGTEDDITPDTTQEILDMSNRFMWGVVCDGSY